MITYVILFSQHSYCIKVEKMESREGRTHLMKIQVFDQDVRVMGPLIFEDKC